MYSKTRQLSGNTSTPKRRCTRTSKVLRPALRVISNKTNLSNYSDTSSNQIIDSSLERCESPGLPCNQVEYLCDSGEASSVCSQIPCSPDILEGIDNWDSFVVPKNGTFSRKQSISKEIINELDDLSDDMFQSKLELSLSVRDHADTKEMLSKTEINFINNVEKSFELVNRSICELQTDEEKVNRSSLFETKDSFLLDIRETGIMLEDKIQNEVKKISKQTNNKFANNNTFYGLPLMTKNLFKSFRNIEKFYDWQEECLNLDAIKEHRNLIYALPTSGGKTLVAEVLMLREVLNSKKNALFILPFVALVQEKIWAMSPFAVNLDFLVEEYAGGKGHIPPKKRRRKNSIYIATIEKGLALIRSLIELNRLHEIGLIVVDELHLIGEPGRGGTLETLLSTVIFANSSIQIVGMSATIGNLSEIAKFLQAEIFQRDFRPVELTEYVKLGDMLHKIVCGPEGVEVVPDRGLAYDYSAAATSLDPDWLGGLVSEVVPQDSCLVFCPTKRNCENVAQLLCKLQRREMTSHRTKEREDLEKALRSEGTNSDLCRSIRYGVAYHHAGLASDERMLLEHAFRSGVISVICCTSTLAAGVNLPARRVIIRAPFVGREHLSLANYRQMVGRAGRAGLCQAGESIIICSERDWPRLRAIFQGGLSPAKSNLDSSAGSLILSAVALKLATDRARLRELLACTLLAVQNPEETVKKLCDDYLRSHIQCGALEISSKGVHNPEDSHTSSAGSCYVYNDTVLAVSQLGNAAIKGCMELTVAKQLLRDLEVASKALVLMGSLHLLYLVSPHDAAGIRPDYSHYYSLYCDLDEEGVQTAKILGITEVNAIRMMTGKPTTNVSESVLGRFYVALMLRDLWRQIPVPAVAYKYGVSRGTVQSVMTSSSSFAACAQRVCEELPSLWTFRALLSELASRLQHCAAPELSQLMELPAVKKARAIQLMRTGFKRIEDLAKASADELVTSVDHLTRTAANHLISAARMMLIEKVENLRAEAEDVMDELKVS